VLVTPNPLDNKIFGILRVLRRIYTTLILNVRGDGGGVCFTPGVPLTESPKPF
jgi:hypothetical protein